MSCGVGGASSFWQERLDLGVWGKKEDKSSLVLAIKEPQNKEANNYYASCNRLFVL